MLHLLKFDTSGETRIIKKKIKIDTSQSSQNVINSEFKTIDCNQRISNCNMKLYGIRKKSNFFLFFISWISLRSSGFLKLQTSRLLYQFHNTKEGK